MDPVSQVVTRNCIEQHGLSIVGWYHSHPTFRPEPSVTDIDNQGNYQNLFQQYETNNDATSKNKKGPVPFIGLIVGTYECKSNPVLQSLLKLKDLIELYFLPILVYSYSTKSNTCFSMELVSRYTCCRTNFFEWKHHCESQFFVFICRFQHD